MAKEWTVLFFLANDNDLTKFTKQKLKEIASLGTTCTTNVIVQFDTLGTSRIRRFLLKDGKRSRLPGLLTETNTGDKRVLIDFINRTRDEYPSNRSILVISSHGTGLDGQSGLGHDNHTAASRATENLTWEHGAFRTVRGKPVPAAAIRRQLRRRARRMKSPLFPAAALRSVTRDLNTGKVELTADELDNLELKAALLSSLYRNGGFDVIAFDSCLMNTFEVAYQLRGTASYIMGSQSEIPAPGCRLTPILEKMQDSALETRELVKFIVDNAVEDIVDDQYAAPSALDLSKADDLARAIDALAKAMLASLGDDAAFRAITRAHYAAQGFMESETVDLFDFCTGLVRRTDGSIRAAATIVQDEIRKFVVHSNPRGAIVENGHGISIYFPKRDHICELYSRLDFARDTTWLKFLEAYRKRLFPPEAVAVEEPTPELVAASN